MNIFNIPRIPLDPPPFIMQFDCPVEKGTLILEEKINASGRLKEVREYRGESKTYILSLFSYEISISVIQFGFIHDYFFGPYGGNYDYLPRIFTGILANLEATTDKTSLYIELPQEMDNDNNELLMLHLTSVFGGYCDYLPNCNNYSALNNEDHNNVYVEESRDYERVLAELEKLILSGIKPA